MGKHDLASKHHQEAADCAARSGNRRAQGLAVGNIGVSSFGMKYIDLL